jgi:hypothetical protein
LDYQKRVLDSELATPPDGDKRIPPHKCARARYEGSRWLARLTAAGAHCGAHPPTMAPLTEIPLVFKTGEVV